MKRFQGKTALVTGGASGIGQAIAERFKAEGATVFTAQRSRDANFPHIEADLTQADAPQMVIDHVIAETGQLDVLVNNAGMMREASIEEMTLQDWHQTMALNLTAPFLLIKSALPHLRKQQGAIVNIGSIEGIGANPNHAAYVASKAGLHGLTKSVAVDHGKDGIRCNAIAPGWIDTDLNNAFIDSQTDPKAFRDNIGGIHPIGRTGKPEEVAALAAFLAADESGFITGQVYTVDGGRMTKLSLP